MISSRPVAILAFLLVCLAFPPSVNANVDDVAVNNSTVNVLDVQKLVRVSISKARSAHARDNARRKLFETQTESYSFTCGYDSYDCYEEESFLSSACGQGGVFSCGHYTQGASSCRLTVDYTYVRCLVMDLFGLTFSQANTFVSDCDNFDDLGVEQLSGIHGGDLDDGECNAPTRPLTSYYTWSCDVSGKIQYEEKYVLRDSSKTLTDVSFETDCRSSSRSDFTVTYTYSSTATSGTQTYRIQALCLSALAVCVTLLVY